MKSRKFTLECKWESCDRTDEELIGEPVQIEVPRLKDSKSEVAAAIAVANRILMRSGGYERGKITTIIIYDVHMREVFANLSINQNEETHEIYHCELSEAMQTLIFFLFHAPRLVRSQCHPN